jgi:hypothetical protein
MARKRIASGTREPSSIICPYCEAILSKEDCLPLNKGEWLQCVWCEGLFAAISVNGKEKKAA